MHNRETTIHIPWRLLTGLLLVGSVLGTLSITEFSRYTLVGLLVYTVDVSYGLLLAFLCFQGSSDILSRFRAPVSQKQSGRRFIPAFLGTGILFLVFGLLLWVPDFIRTQHVPAYYPSPTRIFPLGAYPFFIAALLLLPSQNLTRLSRLRILFDSLIIMVTVTTLYCYAVLIPILATVKGMLLQNSMGSFYADADLVLLFCLLLVGLRSGEAAFRPVIVLLGLAWLILFVGHVVFLSVLLSTPTRRVLPISPGWFVGLALITVAARMVSHVLRSGESTVLGPAVLLEDTGMSARWKAFLTVAPVLIFVLLILALLRHNDSAVFAARLVVVDIGGIGILLLLVLRQLLAMHEVNNLKRDLRAKNSELGILNAQLDKLAASDPLTGVSNHRTLVIRLAEALECAKEQQTTCSVLFMDIDHFKAINDQHGHAAGDLVLCRVAELAESLLRPEDCLGRWGGEEFVAVLPGQDLDEAFTLAERIRTRVSMQMFAGQEDLHVTCSLGVATYPQTATEPQRLINSADQAMYEAKRLGRDQVCTACEAEGAPPEKDQDSGLI